MSDYFEKSDLDLIGDPLFYHKKIQFILVQETPRAYEVLLKEFNREFTVFIPKKIVRQKKENSMYVHTDTYYKILREKARQLLRSGLKNCVANTKEVTC